MSMGSGCVYSTSSKQKMVARLSTEGELIGVYEVLPQMLWSSYFLEAQGHKIHTKLMQDNQAAMLLEKNGRMSSTKRTRHVNIRFYGVKQHIDDGTVSLEYCPTEDMYGDFFTKPLVGKSFYRLRDKIMNIDPNDKHHSSHRSVLDFEHMSGEEMTDGNRKMTYAEVVVKDRSKPAQRAGFKPSSGV